jgi:hypothetical protein
MSNISSFPTAIPDGDDLILGSQTDVAGTPHTKNFTVQSIVDLAPGGGSGGSYLPLAGGTMSGNIALGSNNITGINTLYGVNANITNVSATNLYGTFWGTIDSTATATTQAISDDSTKVATTEYVDRATGTGSYLPLAGGTLSGNLRIAKTFPSLELQDLPTGSSNSRFIKFLSFSGTEIGSIRHQSGPDGGGDSGITTEFYPTSTIRSSFNVGQNLFEWKMYESSTSAVETAMTVAPKVSSSSRLTLFGGDIEIDEAGDGIILKSPDGTKYKVTVANGGSLVVETPVLSLGYTSLVQLLNQTGTAAPVATEVYNNTGQTFTWSYVSNGIYRITATGTPFAIGKTVVLLNSGNNGSNVWYDPRWSRISDTIIEVTSNDNSITNGSFEIKIYN